MISEKVQARIRTRRRGRVQGAVHLALAVCLLSLTVFVAWNSWNTRKKITAPTWADFKMVGEKEGLIESTMAINADGIPNTIEVNGEMWSIVKVNHFTDIDATKIGPVAGYSISGQTLCAQKTIAYIQDDNPKRLKVTILHEVFHAGACLHGGDEWWNSIDPDNKNHAGIFHLGEFMADFLRANPDFTQWASRQ